MELWLATLVIIVAMVAVGALVTRAWRPQQPAHAPRSRPRRHGSWWCWSSRPSSIAARIAVGPLAAAVTGVVGVLIAIAVLILTGYARIPRISRTRR